MSTHIKIGQPYIKVKEYEPRGIGIDIEVAVSPKGATSAFISSWNENVVAEPTNHLAIATLGYIDAVRGIGLEEMFDDQESGFSRFHPCGPITTLLTNQHLSQIQDALKRLKATMPDKLGYIGFLEWHAYWMRWALDNCKTPAIWVFA